MAVEPHLQAVRVPTLVMHGRQDRNVPIDEGRKLAEHIPNSRFYAFKGRGHLPVTTASEKFCTVLRHFLQTGKVPDSDQFEA